MPCKNQVISVVRSLAIITFFIFLFCVLPAFFSGCALFGVKAPACDETAVVPALGDSFAFTASKSYVETPTVSSGNSLSKDELGISFSYESEFYGATAAINRPYVRYGRNFLIKDVFGDCPLFQGDIVIADLNGDKVGDIVSYSDGVITFATVTSIEGGDSWFRDEEVFVARPANEYMVTDLRQVTVESHTNAVLSGAGDINGDGYTDLLFSENSVFTIYYGYADGFRGDAFSLDGWHKGTVRTGDVDGDGLTDVLIADGCNVYYYRNMGDVNRDNRFDLPVECTVLPKGGGASSFLCADINCDGRADVVFIEKSFFGKYRIRSLFGDGAGRFGSSDNKNLFSVYEADGKYKFIKLAAGDISGNGAADLTGIIYNGKEKKNMILYSVDEAAYDYSLFGMKTGDEYRLYSGCRWSDANTLGDGDHVMLSTSKDGSKWFRYIDAPMFYLGGETGESGWWADNTLEPEVLYVDGVYYMYWQCTGVTPGGVYGDKIGVATSSDGIHWIRKTDEPVIICDDPEIGFDHEEVIYVPDDPDGKPFWMYTGHFVNGVFSGHIRIRSKDPERFLFSDRENTGGIAQVGNQIGYMDLSDGSRVFIRITFTTIEEKRDSFTVPTLQFSRDGLSFYGIDGLVLAGVDRNDPRNAERQNVYFLGIVTENGTGRILPDEDGSFKLLYLATCANGAGGAPIFLSEGGLGSVTLRFDAQDSS